MALHGAYAFLLALGLGAALTACSGPASPDEDAELAPSETSESPTDEAAFAQDFQRSLEGIWSTERAQGDDAEVIYAFEWQATSGLRILRDGVWLHGTVEDVDLANETLAFHIARNNGPSETVTFRRQRATSGTAGFTLRVTWGLGQTDDLGFVRRLTDRDRQEITLAITQASVLPEAVACGGDAPPDSLRARLACSDAEFAELDRGLRTQLVELSARYPDGDRTAAAVVRQLDACTTPACLREVHAQWQAYFDENYDLGDVLDYL
ncbi:hypothetical protein [Luteimonas terrae]|uniref:DUF1311 domain-containing protein n=1 Tax=Luteimonas terrae TaxID=1530191 RepID=A0A4R5UBF8_9GAMM|nr:hypothetical protein [Luteimonas terrae]TDK32535.1 hypothetical protein E2F49_00175 [Luteimonas terrae]